jgi:hypothetical protein
MSCRMALDMRCSLLVESSCEAKQSKARTRAGSTRQWLGIVIRSPPERATKRKLEASCPAAVWTAFHRLRRSFSRLPLTTAFLTDDSCSGRASRETLAANGVGALQIRIEPVLRGAVQRAYQIRGRSDDGTTT